MNTHHQDLGRDIAERVREAGALSRTFRAARRLDLTAEGRDRTRSVRVTIDGRGVVESVHIDHAWSRRMEPATLGAALMESYGEAFGAVLRQAAEAMADAERATADGHGWHEDDRPDDDPGTDDRPRAVEERQGGTGPRAVTGPDGLIEVTVTGTQVIGIAVDEYRVDSASGGQLAREAMAAFRVAQQPGKG